MTTIVYVIYFCLVSTNSCRNLDLSLEYSDMATCQMMMSGLDFGAAGAGTLRGNRLYQPDGKGWYECDKEINSLDQPYPPPHPAGPPTQ